MRTGADRPGRLLGAVFVLALLAGVPAGAGEAGEYRGQVVGGGPAADGSWPFVAALVDPTARRPVDGQFCGATLVADRWALTAAHCVADLRRDEVEVFAGAVDLSDEGGMRIGVDRIVVHPEWTDAWPWTADLALVRLATPHGLPTVRTASGLDWQLAAPGAWPTLLGWGATDPDGREYPERLHQATTRVSAGQDCVSEVGGFAPGWQTCTEHPRAAACVGDSGGPLVTVAGRDPVQIGIVSSGPERCGLGGPDVHTEVAAYRPWITTTIGQQDGTPVGTRVRLGVGDRYADAAAISRHTFAPGQPIVFVATGEQFPDGLAGGALAARSGPLLLVPPEGVPATVEAELQRLRPERIVIFGGVAAVSEEAEEALRRYAPTSRLAGDDRYETAAAVSGAWSGPVEAVFVATGEAFPDALASVPLTKDSGPVLLTRAAALPDVTAQRIAALAPRRVVVLGGQEAISAAVAQELAAYAPVRRIGGDTRFDTAALLATDHLAPQRPPFAYVAPGDDFAHALAGGVAAAFLDSPLLLTRAGTVDGAVATAITALAPRRVVVLGGPEQVSEEVAAGIEALTGR